MKQELILEAGCPRLLSCVSWVIVESAASDSV